MSSRTSDEDRAALVEDVTWLAGTDHPEHIARRVGYASPDSLASVLARWGAPDLAHRTPTTTTPTPPHRRHPMIEHTDDWRADAACREYDPDLWHLDEHVSADDVEITERARAVCFGCPVRAQCLAEAMADRRLSGVWGGTTTDERDRMRRRVAYQTEKAARAAQAGLEVPA